MVKIDVDEQFIIDNQLLMHYLLEKHRNLFDDAKDFEDYKEEFMPEYIRVCKSYNPKIGKLSAYLTKHIYYYTLHYLGNGRKRGYNRMVEKNFVSLDSGLYINSEEHNYYDLIENKHDDIHNKILIKDIYSYLKNNLNEKDYDIFMRYLNGEIQCDIAKIYNVTQVYISRTIKRIQNELKKEFK